MPVEDNKTTIQITADPTGDAAVVPPAERTVDAKTVTNGVDEDADSAKSTVSNDVDGKKDELVTNGTEAKEDEASTSENDENSKSSFEVAQLQMALRYVQSELVRRGVPESKLSGLPYSGIPPPPPPPPPPGMYPHYLPKRPAANPNTSPEPEKPEEKSEDGPTPVARVRGSKKEYRRLDEL